MLQIIRAGEPQCAHTKRRQPKIEQIAHVNLGRLTAEVCAAVRLLARGNVRVTQGAALRYAEHEREDFR